MSSTPTSKDQEALDLAAGEFDQRHNPTLDNRLHDISSRVAALESRFQRLRGQNGIDVAGDTISLNQGVISAAGADGTTQTIRLRVNSVDEIGNRLGLKTVEVVGRELTEE